MSVESLPFLDPDAPKTPEVASVIVLPVPYEGTVSYGHGTARGPQAILAASHQIEFHDERLGFEPRRAGIWTAPPLVVEGEAPVDVVRQVRATVGEWLDRDKWVVMLGGEHSITPGAVAAARERHADLVVVQLDAHADLREAYAGDRFSHACAMARCLEYAPVRAVGIRSFGPEEAEKMRPGLSDYSVLYGWELGEAGWIDRVLDGLDGRSVYLTIDVDYFDPSIVPATGTPEPGGGTWWPTLQLLDRLFHRTQVVATDVVELAPVEGLHHPDFTVARLVHKLIGLATRRGGRAETPGTATT